MADQLIPTDQFSRRRRELVDNPGAIASASTINLADFYGNLETWIVETFRVEGGQETGFLQRSAHDGATRLVLPPEIMAALRRQQGSVVTQSRRRGARQALATKRAKGIRVGNPEALRKARRARGSK